MNASFDPRRSDAIRTGLIAHAERTAPRRRTGWAIGLVLVGAIAGAGVSAGAFAATDSITASPRPVPPSGQPEPELGDAVTAPAGVVPGTPIISLLGEPTGIGFTGPVEIPLGDRPPEATHARVIVTALTAGSLSYGTDPNGNNPHGSWSGSDIGSPSSVSWFDFPLDATTTYFFFTPGSGFTGTATLQYVAHVPTRLGVNGAGQTFGTAEGDPDLVAVSGVAPDGQPVQGYVNRGELDATSPEHPGRPSNPAEALRWQAERELAHPDGWDIPVFTSDGTTRIGSFHIG
ncbi:hypothetical protein ACL9RL_09910 [Plantibacter sp. Mn2098]|uniref:hypothetical protein n=1 Tax=Plantibacter sp. Mn2098 TaxID=3395266 RepID=UPI003BC2F177